MFKLSTAAAVLALAGAASANPIVQTLSFGPDTPNFGETLTFNKYAGPAGDIVSIEVEFTLDVSGGTLGVDNDGIDPATVTVELGASGAISSTDVALIDNAFQPVASNLSVSSTDLFNLAADDGDGVDYQPGGADNGVLAGVSGSDLSGGLINPAVFGDYAGGGTFDILVDVTQILDFGGIGGVAGTFTPVSASGDVTITYNLIPTPGAAALLGVAGLAAVRRRR